MSGDHDHRQGCAAGICLGFSPPVFCLRSRMHIPLKPSRWLHCCYFLHLFFFCIFTYFFLCTPKAGRQAAHLESAKMSYASLNRSASYCRSHGFARCSTPPVYMPRYRHRPWTTISPESRQIARAKSMATLSNKMTKQLSSV